MAYDRITQIKNLLFLRETKRRIGNKTVNYTAIQQLIEGGISDRVVVLSPNPLFLKAIEQNIKGNIITILMNPFTIEVCMRMVFPLRPDVIILDYQEPHVHDLTTSLTLKGYEVYEF